ncbi:MAG: cell envelope integrity protein TolA [Holosporaceae bacterium]|jgi:TolA protein|nr:cell envelope integrity protein TolA [Holosporaceae bacterium]
MRRKKSDQRLERFLTYSLLLHVFILAMGAVPFFTSKENNLLLTDIQIAGEGELGDLLESPQRELPEISNAVENKSEAVVPVEETQQEIQRKEIQQIFEPLESADQEEISKDTTDTTHDNVISAKNESHEKELLDENSQEGNKKDNVEDNIKDDMENNVEDNVKDDVENNMEDNVKDSVGNNMEDNVKDNYVKDNKEDSNVVDEEPVPRPETRDEKEKAPEEKKKPRKRNRKALMDVIKKAEKKRARAKNRKKVLEIAEKAAYRKRKNASFNKMLSGTINDLRKDSGQGAKGNGAGSFGYGLGLTNEDQDMIRSQVSPHWIVLSGVRNAETIVVDLQIQLRDNGGVINVQVIDEKRYASDHVFRAAADSARRAVLKASPFKIPRNKIDLFRNFVFHFDPREDLGG